MPNYSVKCAITDGKNTYHINMECEPFEPTDDHKQSGDFFCRAQYQGTKIEGADFIYNPKKGDLTVTKPFQIDSGIIDITPCN